jgi:DNA-binding response OmpR family regulator
MAQKNKSSDISKEILLVEDDIDLTKFFGEIFKKYELKVTVVYNGEDALKKMEEKKFGLVFLDINLPGISGFEVLKKMKAKTETKNIPVVILSSHGEMEYIDRGMELGANDYTIKSNVDMKKVRELVSKYLRV